MHDFCETCSDCVCNLPFRAELEMHGYTISQNVEEKGVQTIVLASQKKNPKMLLQYIDVLGNPAIGAIGYLLSGEDNSSWDENIYTELVREGGFLAEILDNPLIARQYRVYRKEGSYTLSLDDAAELISAITGENIEVDEATPVMDISTEPYIPEN